MQSVQLINAGAGKSWSLNFSNNTITLPNHIDTGVYHLKIKTTSNVKTFTILIQ